MPSWTRYQSMRCEWKSILLGHYLKYFTLVAVGNVLVLDAYNLFIGKDATVLFWENLAFRAFSSGPDVFVP